VSEPILLQLGEHEFRLRLDMTACADLEAQTGISLLNGGKVAQDALRQDGNIRTALWAFAGGEDTGLTPREFGRLVGLEDLEHAMSCLSSMFTRDLPKPREGGGSGKAKASRSPT
jgi:hypothetical protein